MLDPYTSLFALEIAKHPNIPSPLPMTLLAKESMNPWERNPRRDNIIEVMKQHLWVRCSLDSLSLMEIRVEEVDEQMDPLAFLSVSKTSLLRVCVTWLSHCAFENVLGTLPQTFHSAIFESTHCILDGIMEQLWNVWYCPCPCCIRELKIQLEKKTQY